jgi:hypothetical protein
MTASRVPPHPTLMAQYEDRFQRALNIAIYYQNQCCELEEIIEMFCFDAEATVDLTNYDYNQFEVLP